ncbi:hypothetical protein RvY_01119 [Ramazzottius varieornatus]|uniref:Chitin-binding type-2 domain-containing protein n=1 Tax=Ramazzottius varieornatus TaxID=947166 RepID=A0A1D1UG29_RAMVA|nr:hypothetical protein RvY_01119 [Ramazzottius varieornatus]
MRSFIALVALVSCVAAQNVGRQQYVYDIIRPQLDAASVVDILLNAQPGVTYPTYAGIPQTNFACPAQPGFYADVNAQCQVFHRCDINGNITSYLCVNTTLFNQITLVCDYFWNVDCPGQQQYASFANSRLYTDQQLFDTPPADYVAPSQLLAQQQQQEQLNGQAAAAAQAGQAQGATQGQKAQGNRIQARPQVIGAQAGRPQTNQGRLTVNTQTANSNRFVGRAGAIVGTGQNQVTGTQAAGGAFAQGNTATSTNSRQGAAAAANANLQGTTTTQITTGGAADQTADQAATGADAATEGNSDAAAGAEQAGTGTALNVALLGANGQTSAAQINPGQTATLQAGGTAVSATNAGGNAQVTAQ